MAALNPYSIKCLQTSRQHFYHRYLFELDIHIRFNLTPSKMNRACLTINLLVLTLKFTGRPSPACTMPCTRPGQAWLERVLYVGLSRNGRRAMTHPNHLSLHLKPNLCNSDGIHPKNCNKSKDKNTPNGGSKMIYDNNVTLKKAQKILIFFKYQSFSKI